MGGKLNWKSISNTKLCIEQINIIWLCGGFLWVLIVNGGGDLKLKRWPAASTWHTEKEKGESKAKTQQTTNRFAKPKTQTWEHVFQSLIHIQTINKNFPGKQNEV